MAKRYKRYKWAQLICFLLAIVSCILPPIIATLTFAPSLECVEDRLALDGVAIFFSAVVLLVVFRSLVKKLIAKIPFTLVVMLSLGVMLLLFICLRRIVDDAITMLVIGLIGSGGGFLLEIASIYLGNRAEEEKEIYMRTRGDGNV
jgi:hypothetical protein